MSEHPQSFPWLALFVVIQVALILALWNPWILTLRWVAIVFLTIEAMVVVFWALPVFLFNFLFRRRAFGESVRRTVQSIIEFLSFTSV